MKKVNDGWHMIANCEVYVENGKVVRGIKHDHYAGKVTGYPYRGSRDGGWDLDQSCSPDTFRAAVKRGTMMIL